MGKIIESYDFYEAAQSVWAYSGTAEPNENLEVLGIRALRTKRGLKPTSAFIRVIGAHATKNTVVLSDEEMMKFMAGKSVEDVCKGMRGYVIVLSVKDVLGCGLCTASNTLMSQIPKKYRIASTWL